MAWHSRLALFFVVAITTLILQLTGNPFLAATMPYVRASLPIIRSAVWLRRLDPDASRAKTCFWFYLATAGWLAATQGFAIVLIGGVILQSFGAQPNMDWFAGTMTGFVIGLSASSILGVIATILSLVRGVQVCAIPNLYDQCDGELSMISQIAGRRVRYNVGFFVLCTSLIVPVLAITGVSLVSLAGAAAPNAIPTSVEVALLIGLIIGPIAVLCLAAYLSNKVIAWTPEDCWPDLMV